MTSDQVDWKTPDAVRRLIDETSPYPSSFEELLSGRDKTFERLLRAPSVPENTAKAVPRLSSLHSRPVSPDQQRPEVFILKPNFHGIGIDLKEAGRRVRRWLKERWTSSSQELSPNLG